MNPACYVALVSLLSSRRWNPISKNILVVKLYLKRFIRSRDLATPKVKWNAGSDVAFIFQTPSVMNIVYSRRCIYVHIMYLATSDAALLWLEPGIQLLTGHRRVDRGYRVMSHVRGSFRACHGFMTKDRNGHIYAIKNGRESTFFRFNRILKNHQERRRMGSQDALHNVAVRFNAF